MRGTVGSAIVTRFFSTGGAVDTTGVGSTDAGVTDGGWSGQGTDGGSGQGTDFDLTTGVVDVFGVYRGAETVVGEARKRGFGTAPDVGTKFCLTNDCPGCLIFALVADGFGFPAPTDFICGKRSP